MKNSPNNFSIMKTNRIDKFESHTIARLGQEPVAMKSIHAVGDIKIPYLNVRC